jgi:hypothetical protein
MFRRSPMLGTPADSYLRKATERLLRAANERPDAAARDLVSALEEVIRAVEQIDARLTVIEKGREPASASPALEQTPASTT